MKNASFVRKEKVSAKLMCNSVNCKEFLIIQGDLQANGARNFVFVIPALLASSARVITIGFASFAVVIAKTFTIENAMFAISTKVAFHRCTHRRIGRVHLLIEEMLDSIFLIRLSRVGGCFFLKFLVLLLNHFCERQNGGNVLKNFFP